MLIVVVSNNKLFNRVSHNVVTWDVYLRLFINPSLTHFCLIPVDSLLEITGNLLH